MRWMMWVVVALSAAVVPALSQSPTFKPFKPIEVDIPKPPKDPAFDAFRRQLAAIAADRNRAALKAQLGGDVFWENDVEGAYNDKRTDFDNLLSALHIDRDPARGWAALAAFAAEPTTGALHLRRNVFCAPSPPKYADADLYTAMEESGSDVSDWYYPRQAGLAVRGAPQPDAAAIDSLGVALVRVLGFVRPRAETQTPQAAWARVVTPSGRVGFVAPNALLSPLANRLCFAKEGAAWRIVGFIGGGN